MNQPVLSIDVAKGKSVVAAFLSYKEIFQSPITVAHSENELSTLLVLIKEMESLSTTVVLEATGNYSKPIASFFSSHTSVLFRSVVSWLRRCFSKYVMRLL